MDMEINKIYNEDCMEVLYSIEDNSIDLVVLDPDYNDWDNLCRDGLICQSVRVLKPTGNIICFTKQPFDFELRNEVAHIFRREIIWTFCNGGAWVSNKMPLVSFQKIYWCTPYKKDCYFNPRTGMPYNDKTPDIAKRKSKVFEGYNKEGRDFVKSNEGIWLRDHLHFNKPNMGEIPAKPLSLIDIIIRCFCPAGGIVLDPFVGSGNIIISAKRNDRRFIGFEKSLDVYQLALSRIGELDF